jgi:hypothetical protein
VRPHRLPDPAGVQQPLELSLVQSFSVAAKMPYDGSITRRKMVRHIPCIAG